jgi:GT2 family glycosyltransferase
MVGEVAGGPGAMISYGTMRAARPIPHALCASDVAVVVPVRDNQAGIDRLLAGFRKLDERPREIVIVDNRSSVVVTVDHALREELSVVVLEAPRPGPAHARNVGWRAASAPWILFTDSDCVPAWDLFDGLSRALDGAVAYAGNLRCHGAGPLVDYYESQRTHIPRALKSGEPNYLVTANALVWRDALEEIGGFDERFEHPGGEDIDLARRLRRVGRLSWAPDAVLTTDFGYTLGEFARRFVNYGRGERRLESIYGWNHVPWPFLPDEWTALNFAAAAGQFLFMYYGYKSARIEPTDPP